MGYGVFRRAPRVGPPLRKKLAIGLLPARSLDTPPLQRHKPQAFQLKRDRRANYKRRKVLAPVFTAQPVATPSDFIHVATRRIVPMFRRDVFRWKWTPKVILTCAPIPALIPGLPPAVPLHPHTVPWLKTRRKPPPRQKPRRLLAQLIAGLVSSPPLRRPRPTWRLYRKPAPKRQKRRWPWQLFNTEPTASVRWFRWFVRPARIVAKSLPSRSIAARLFVKPAPPPPPPPVVPPDTHDGGLPRREGGKPARYSDAVLRKVADERERKRLERDRVREELTALVEGRPLTSPEVVPSTVALPPVIAPQLDVPALSPAEQYAVLDRINALQQQIAALNSEIAQADRRQREEEQIILLILGLYDD